MATRRAIHAGSWYSDDESELRRELESYLDEAKPGNLKKLGPGAKLRALIGPHAGLSYSGKTAAHGYVDLLEARDSVNRIFLLGPSHHVYLEGCAVSGATTYATPVGDIKVDEETVASLRATGSFPTMSMRVDEEEHSLELHCPYIAHVMKGKDFTLVPIMVGSITSAQERAYGDLLGPYLEDPGTIAIASSDFCHWGRRFSFQYVEPKCNPCDIYKSIENLDREGMALIESKSASGFRDYLSRTMNTICGRMPISIMLATIARSKCAPEIKFVHYDQSSRVTSFSDSSVSYASAICYTL